MNSDILKKLYENFNIKERPGYGNKTFKYISSADIIDRMNKVFNGCWETEVTYQERFDDYVLVCVKVSVHYDNKVYSHDGYGGSIIAKLTSGQNKGKAVDIANSYKSAEAKAIRNACSRWGVGLYIEENEGLFEINDENKKDKKEETQTKFPDFNKEPQTKFPDFNKEPLTDIDNKEKNNTIENKNPFSVSNNNDPFNSNSTDNPFGNGSTTNSLFSNKNNNSTEDIFTDNKDDSLTDIQKAAITNILDIKLDNSLTYDEMVVKALDIDDSDIPKIDELTYKQAVTVINFGNNMIKRG